jgi:hypothetical protein
MFTKAKVAPEIEQSVVAAKIQFTFRGFCVRNSNRLEKLRIILKVKFDADKIGHRFTNATQKKLIVENEDERIKLDDQITSLLLWIDAIQESVLTAFFSSRIETILGFYGIWNFTGDMQVLLCLTLIV